MLTWIPLKTRMAPTISKAGPAAAPQSLYRTGWQLAKVRAILWLALACGIGAAAFRFAVTRPGTPDYESKGSK